MLDALSAETLKLTRHKATWFLVWIYPILFLTLFLMAIAINGFLSSPGSGAPTASGWIARTTAIWKWPGQTVGGFLIGAYVAVAFAGEYGWNTWKLIVPHRGRASLIAAKFGAVTLLFAVSFALTAAVSLPLTWAAGASKGQAVPAGVTAATLLHAHGNAALGALAPLLFVIATTSLAAVLTRSMVAALVINIVVATLDQLLVGLAPLLYMYAPGLIRALLHILPGYHLANLDSWIAEGGARLARFPDGSAVALGWTASLAAIAAWIAALTAGTFATFKRQDIN